MNELILHPLYAGGKSCFRETESFFLEGKTQQNSFSIDFKADEAIFQSVLEFFPCFWKTQKCWCYKVWKFLHHFNQTIIHHHQEKQWSNHKFLLFHLFISGTFWKIKGKKTMGGFAEDYKYLHNNHSYWNKKRPYQR